MCPVYLGNFWTKRKIGLHKYGCFWTSSICLKNSSLAPGPTLPPGLVLLSMCSSSYSSPWLLAASNSLLLPALHWLWFWWVWLDATRSSSSEVLPCGWIYMCLPPHTLWKVSYMLSIFAPQSSQQRFYSINIIHSNNRHFSTNLIFSFFFYE